MLLSDSYFFLRHRAICVFWLFASEFTKSQTLKLTVAYQGVQDQRCQNKNLNILRTKKVLKAKQKAFFMIVKGFSFKQIKPTFLEGGIPTLKNL